ncbi:MFS transporter [Porticoccus sp.]
MKDQSSDQHSTPDTLRRAAFAMVLLNALATPMMLSAVNVALPGIARELTIHAVLLSWVPLGYLMASAMFVLVFGRLADMFGRKRIFLLGTASIIVTSVLATAASNGPLLIAARFLQGVGAAMLYATQIAIVSSVFPPAQRGKSIGLTVSMIYLGLSLGPAAGGFLVEHYGWRASFLLHIPLSTLSLLIGWLWVRGEWKADSRAPFDYRGALSYALSILCLCVGAAGLPQTYAFFLLSAGGLGMALFVHQAGNSHAPLLDVRLFFGNRTFARSSLASFIMYTATFATVVLVGLYLQFLKGMSPSRAGLLMMIQPLTMALLSPLSGRLSDVVEPRIIASLGMAATALGLIILARLSGDDSVYWLVAGLLVIGLGFSLFSSPNTNAMMSAVDRQHLGTASGLVATMRVLGQMSSMVLVALVFALLIGEVEIVPAQYAALERAIARCFAIAAGLCVLGVYVSAARGKIHR